MLVRPTGPSRLAKQVTVAVTALLLVACDSLKNVERKDVEPAQLRAWTSSARAKNRRSSRLT
jgi:uncharacterized protein YcfL